MAKDSIIYKIMALLWELGAKIIFKTDAALDRAEEFWLTKILPWLKEGCQEIRELLEAGDHLLVEIGAGLIFWWDTTGDLIEWFLTKIYVTARRDIHDIRMNLLKHRKMLVNHGVLFLIVGVGMLAIYGAAIDYEYSYNGRVLGIVREQRDVLEIMDLVSEELTAEYGASITIDPTTDITFRPVISYGRDVDDADTVLKRFTYMGDIQVESFAIKADGKTIAIVDSKKTADEVLDEIKQIYVKGKESKYEYIGFEEKIKIEPHNTILARVSSKSAAVKKIKNGGQEEVRYKVVEGDSLYGICEKLGISLDELKAMNENVKEDMFLHVGDEFVTTQQVALLSVKTVETAYFAEKVKYKTIHEKSSKYYQGDTVVERKGKDGKARVTARLTKVNGKTVDRDDITKEIIQEPVSKLVIKGTRKAPPKHGTGAFMKPVNVAVYSGYGMRWGRMHYGLDYAAPVGTAIHAADGGVVVQAGWSGAYGNLITINHHNGFVTLYGHCSRVYVHVGQKVFKGETIGAIGSTGRSTGPHCHFEIKKNGINVNPSGYV